MAAGEIMAWSLRELVRGPRQGGRLSSACCSENRRIDPGFLSVNGPLARLIIAISALLCSLSAAAGGVSFRLSLTGSQLTVINQGDSSAFYPAVFRMLADGSWESLQASAALAEMAPGARLQRTWPDSRPLEQVPELERMQPVMVRFFDQAGVYFGQISFLHAPPVAKTTLKARYVNGVLRIDPPDGMSSIRASRVLWPQEEGIRPIRRPVHFVHRPRPALRIDWRHQRGVPFQIDTGAGRPAAILLHETAQGYALQHVPDGGLQGREQRAAWLDAAPKFYAASLIALAVGLGAMLLPFLRRPRGRADSS